MSVESYTPFENAPVKDKQGLGIASLVLGIISLCGSWVPILNFCLALLAVAGIITGILGLKSSKKGLAIAGMVISILSICIVIGSIIFWASIDTSWLQDPSLWENFFNQMN